MKSIHASFAALMLAGLVSACARPGGTATAPAAPSATPAGEAAAQPAPAARTAPDAGPDSGGGKSAAPVDIRVVHADKAQAGVPLPVSVSVTPTQPMDGLTVEIDPGEGIAMLERSAPAAFAAPKTGEALLRSVTLKPVRDGLFYLRVIATSRVGEQAQSKVMLFPIKVGDAAAGAALKNEGPVQVTPGGERIISLPAAEDRPK
ncbi:MAG: hypothetical protein NVS9B10_22640 [Nevskia sp.]